VKSISSRANAGFRRLTDLVGASRERRRHQAAWIEGERLCESFFARQQPAQALVISDAQDVDALFETHGANARECWVIHAGLFREISQLESSPGWGLVIDEPAQTIASRPCDLVIFDRIQDPGNLGSMLRSAAAAGVHQAWCLSGTVDAWSPKVLRSAMGAHFAIDILTGLEESMVIDQTKALGISLLATANDPSAVSLFSCELRLDQSCAWVFGQEGQGVSHGFLQAASRVAIPQSSRVESLNVAAAASVCLFEAKRRRLAKA
jgi:RNA methyltransferase, TrmH family